MSIRKLLVPLFGGVADEMALEAAHGVASLSAAHIEALFMRPGEPGLGGWDTGWLPPWTAARPSKGVEHAALLASEASQRNFETWCAGAGVGTPTKPGSSTELCRPRSGGSRSARSPRSSGTGGNAPT